MPDENLEPLIEVSDRLRGEGFTHDFELTEHAVVDEDTSTSYDAALVEIVQVHRDEGVSNPSDESMLLALRAPDGACGLVTVTYGAESPHAETVRRLGTGVPDAG